jgi:DNA-binding MarR family transcriptional regulator
MQTENTLLFLQHLREIMHGADMRSRRLLRELGISSTQAGVLRALSDGETHSAGDLARSLSLTGATLTGVLDRLEARGWLERVRSAKDKRRMEVRILPAGTDKLNETAEKFQDPLTRGFQDLPEPVQSQILNALSRVTTLFDEPEPEEAPFPFYLNGPESLQKESA